MATSEADAKSKEWLERTVKEIFALAEIENPADYPFGDHACWFPWGGGAAPVFLKPAEPFPLNTDFRVFSFFLGDEEFRVYCIQVADLPADKRPVSPFRCYHLSRASATYFCQSFAAAEPFMRALADEWSEIAHGRSTAEAAAADEAVEEILDYIDSLPEDYRVQQLRDDIERGLPEAAAEPEPELNGSGPAAHAAPTIPPPEDEKPS